MPKIQKIILSDEFECDGCKFEFNDRTTRPCSKCNRNYEMFSDRFQPSNDMDDEDDSGYDDDELPFEIDEDDYEDVDMGDIL